MGANQTRSAGCYHSSLKSSRTSNRRTGSLHDQTFPEPPPLTQDDKRLLQRTWKALEADPTAVGVIMFTRLFEAHPEMQSNFKSFRDLDLEDLKMSQELRQHSSRVMGFVNKLISRLSNGDQLDSLTVELCQRHLTYGATPQHMAMIGEQFVSALRSTLAEDGAWDDDTQAAWENLFRIIVCTYQRIFTDWWSRTQSARGTPQKQLCLQRRTGLNGVDRTTAPGTCCAHTIEY